LAAAPDPRFAAAPRPVRFALLRVAAPVLRAPARFALARPPLPRLAFLPPLLRDFDFVLAMMSPSLEPA
jgi:hypothetical protein